MIGEDCAVGAQASDRSNERALPWGADSEHGRLVDILVGPPDHFCWLPTSAISRTTLDSGRIFEPAAAHAQHAELIAAYQTAGVAVHRLEPDPALPYQVFARDSSVATPWGPLVTQLAQPWRRGEYAPVIGFYRQAGVPVWRMIDTGSLEGGDVMIIEPGCLLIGAGQERTTIAAAEQLAEWFREADWEVRVEPIPPRYVHIDVLVAILAAKLAAVCSEAVSSSLLAWLRGKGFELIELAAADAAVLGVNAVSLGADRVISAAGATTLNAALAARGIEVLAPNLEQFTLGGGGAHCLGQALRREFVGAAR